LAPFVKTNLTEKTHSDSHFKNRSYSNRAGDCLLDLQ